MRVAIVQFYTENVPYGKFSEAINKKYCDEKGYDYYVEKDSRKIKELIEDRAYTWCKPKILLEVLQKKQHDYILFLDIDAIVCDFSKKIEDFIDEKYDIIAAEDFSSHSLMNAGVLLIKNSDWSMKFMKDWWECGYYLRGVDAPALGANNEEFGYFKNALWHDQTCLTYLYNKNERKNHIKIITNKSINWREYKNNNFIFHAFAYGNLKYRKIDMAYYEIFNIKPDLNYKSLTDLCEYFATDKEYEHKYISSCYQEIFEPIKKDVKRFCEIGNGYKDELASAKLWREYFNSEVVVCETSVREIKEDKIKIYKMDQSDENSINEFCKNQENFDVILDDGTHRMKDQQISFAKLFKKLNKNGVYIIEDLHTSLEAKMPEKLLFGWGDPNKTTTLEMLENLEKTRNLNSDYISAEDKKYIEDNFEICKVFRKPGQNWSITSVIKHK